MYLTISENFRKFICYPKFPLKNEEKIEFSENVDTFKIQFNLQIKFTFT